LIERERERERESLIKRLRYIFLIFIQCIYIYIYIYNSLIVLPFLYRLSSLRISSLCKGNVLTLTFFKLISGSINLHLSMSIYRLYYIFLNIELSHRLMSQNRGLWNTAVCIPVHCSRDRWSKSPLTRQVVGMSRMSTDTSRQHLPTFAVSHPFALRSLYYVHSVSLLFMACKQESRRCIYIYFCTSTTLWQKCVLAGM